MYCKSNQDGTVAIGSTQFAPDAVEVTAFHPSDRAFRGAYTLQGTEVVEDITKAKEIAHEKRRAKRDELFAPHDEIIMKQIPGKDANAVEQARADIRSNDALVQDTINLASDMQTIRDALVGYGVEI